MKLLNKAELRINNLSCDCNDIERRLTALEEGQCDCGAIDERLTNLETAITNIQTDITNIKTDITNIQTELTLIERAVEISDVRTFMRVSPNIPTSDYLYGLGASVISIGPTFNYWGVGALSGAHTWAQNSKIYLVTPAQFVELGWYQGTPTMGTVWYQQGGTSSALSMPIYFDQTGIYIIPASQMNMTSGTTFKFTQALILVDPST